MKKERKFRVRQTFNVELVKQLHKETFPTDEWYDSENTTFYWLVLDEENKKVGFCILALLPDGICFLARSGVSSCARGFGIQRRLIRVREKAARRFGFTSIITYTKIDNIGSSHNLQKCGYQLYLPDYEYADKDCLYWIKRIK